MPTFELVPLEQASSRPGAGKRAAITREYLAYIEQLKTGEAGTLRPSEGESAAAIRRRLGAAAKTAGKELVIRRSGDVVYFWAARRRRGRPRRVGRTGT